MLIRPALVALALCVTPALCRAEATPKFAPLPHKVSSFGACVSGGWLYVYGGHTGKTHTYSTETTTGKVFRVPLSGGSDRRACTPCNPLRGGGFPDDPASALKEPAPPADDS